jgi:hypothetical protein
MKKSVFTIFFLFGFLLAAPTHALDLTPRAVTTAFNGLRVKRYFFEDAGKQMGFRIDNKMTVKGSSDSAEFKFDDLKSAAMQISKSPKNSVTPFEEKGLESYRADARALVPGNATDIQLDQENPGAIAINGWTSYQFIFTYKLFGFDYRRSVTFLNYNKTEQLIMDVSAPTAEFDVVFIRGYQVLNSLSQLRSESAGPT